MSAPPPEWMLGDWPMSVWSVVVATLGVVASTAVAIAAFRASSRANKIALQTRKDQTGDARRHERREFYDAAIQWLKSEEPNLIAHAIVQYPHDLSRLAHVIDSDTAHKLVKWLYEGTRLVAAQGTPSTPDERRLAYNPLMQSWADQSALWVKDAKKHYDWPAFALPTAPPMP